MIAPEPARTALILAIFGVLLATSVILSRASGRAGIPVVLAFLGIGMLAGEEGFGGLAFNDHHLTFRLGTAALALILFDGGLNTPLAAVRKVLGPAAVLATVGVAGTAALVAICARSLGFSWTGGLLLGAVVASTDAAAVFSVLRGGGLHLKRRVGATLELESGLNDPMAVILTLALTYALVAGEPVGAEVLVDIVVQLAVGALLGLAAGGGGRLLLRRVKPAAGGLYPVLTLAIAFLAYGVPTLVYGSGFLAVYVAGVVLGNGPLPYRTGILRVHDFVAWFAQIAMFVAMGLLVSPSRLVGVAGLGLAIALFLAVVARPVAVLACLLPFRFSLRESLYVGWVGLRGAVPIILASFPVLSGVPGSGILFDVVFFVVVVSAILQGGSVRALTGWLGMDVKVPPTPHAVLEIASAAPLRAHLQSFYIDRASAVSGAQIADLPFPPDAAAMLIVRGEELIAPRGATRLEPGDHVYTFCRPEDRPFLRLLFGQEEEE